MRNVPKIAAAHDMSGVGRCSMTVILPILSALGCQVCPLPTAILSNHSEYKDFYFYDFTDHIKEYFQNWEKNNEQFDCMYTGFLGSEHQIDILLQIINKLKVKETLVVVDPVMGDNGKVYKTYTENMINKMTQLVEKANIITPNLTEASIILREEYCFDIISINKVKKYLKNLSLLGPELVLITGIKTDEGEHINVCYDKLKDEYYKAPFEFVNTRYPGTGDLFTSLFIGYIFKGKNAPEAIEEASRFVSSAVKVTYDAKTPAREGVLFEKIMNELFIEKSSYNYSMM